MTPTPRTNAVAKKRDTSGQNSSVYRWVEEVSADFARQLERENAEMLGVLESILPYIEGDTKVPWKPALAVITKAKGVQP
jgi:hypothetical protein